jgi:hypothetical protein
MIIIFIIEACLDPIDDFSNEEMATVLAHGAVNSNDECET